MEGDNTKKNKLVNFAPNQRILRYSERNKYRPIEISVSNLHNNIYFVDSLLLINLS
jgi:hypothetical protein